MSSYFHDLNLSKSLMDTVRAVREGKSEDEIKDIQKKYQKESKEDLDESSKKKSESKEDVNERELTDAEKKKREEIAQAIERENPDMDKSKKMAIATAQAKKTDESVELDEMKKKLVGELRKGNMSVKIHKTGRGYTTTAEGTSDSFIDDVELETDGDVQYFVGWLRRKGWTVDFLSKNVKSESVTEAKSNKEDDVKGGGKVATEPTDEKEKKGKKEPVDINPKMDEEKDDPCWDGYVQYGTKKQDGKEVPNCIPKKEEVNYSYGMSLESIIKQVHKRHK